MIFKKIKADAKKAKSKAAHVRDLTDYINDPQRVKETEKVLYAAGRGFICDDLMSRQHEMIALASEAPKSKNPINHYLLSWREGEQPTPEQIEEAVSILLEELGLVDHQVMYALHQDTDNYHLHIAVNRVHPETNLVVKPNKGFDIEAGHRAITKIEKAQGWQSEKNARYSITESGELAKGQQPAKERQPDQRKRDRENRTGEKSAERVAIENAASIIKESGTWAELHERLAQAGMRYETKGSGALIFVNDIPLKPSSVDRGASLPNLQKRLGVFEPARSGLVVLTRAAEPIKKVAGWSQYKTGRDEHYKSKRETQAELQKRHKIERDALFTQQKNRRDELLKKNWKGKGDLLNAMRSVMAAEHAAHKADMQERQAQERKAHQEQFRPYPDFEAWLREKDRPDLAEEWRYRDSLTIQPARVEGRDPQPRSVPRDIRSFTPTIQGREVRYTHRAGGALAFTDTGKHIAVADERNPAAVLAALQLGAQKFPGGMVLTGNAEYKALCVRLAAEHGLKIINPELQADMTAARAYRNHVKNRSTTTEVSTHVSRTQQSQDRRNHPGIPPAHRRDRLHKLSECNLVTNTKTAPEVLLPENVPGGMGVGNDGRGNANGVRRTGASERGTAGIPAGLPDSRATRYSSRATGDTAGSDLSPNESACTSVGIVRSGGRDTGGSPSTPGECIDLHVNSLSMPDQQAERAAAPAAEEVAEQIEPIEADTLQVDVAMSADLVKEWFAANPELVENKTPPFHNGRVSHIFEDGRWIQHLGRDQVALRQPVEIALKAGQMVDFDKNGKAFIVQKKGKGRADC